MTEFDDQISERLERERPAPAPGFRAGLRARLLSSGKLWPSHQAPERRRADANPPFRALAFSYAAAGALCLLTAAAGLVGAGPFAA